MILRFNDTNNRSVAIRFSPKERLFIFVTVVMFCIHGTDFKIGFVKISELLLLTYLALRLSKISKYSLIFIILFTAYLTISLIISFNTSFYLPSESGGGLKQPYAISVARYLELIGCIGFVEFIRRNITVLRQLGVGPAQIFNALVLMNCVLILLYILDILGIILNLYSIESSLFYYGSYRLKGTFVEGGPHGLCMAFILCLCIPYCKRFIQVIGIISFTVTILLSQSKAGIMMLLAFAFFYIYQRAGVKKWLSFFVLVLFIPLSVSILNLMIKGYLDSLLAVETLLITNRDDPNFVMGRIAGVFIVPKIIISNLWFGIGLGNYPLVRNNPSYTGPFPQVDLWDAPGLGGLVDILLETGILGFCAFAGSLIAIFRMIKLERKQKLHFTLCYILPYICGVQLYFHYPWLALGLLLFASKKPEVSDA